MRPRIRVLTLGVEDLERSVRFYRDGLGLPAPKMLGNDADHTTVAFFDLEGLILALYPRKFLAKDASLAFAPAPAAFSIGHLTTSRAEVDATIARAKKAGATVPEPARERAWGGYSGYFQDPDGHLWEVVWNPDMPEG